MKNFKILFLSAAVLLFSFTLPAKLIDKTARKIIGKWAISKIESSEYKMTDAKNYGEDLIRKMSADSYIIFNADGSFKIHYAEYEKTGTWNITPDSKSIVRTMQTQIDTFEIVLSDKANLKLKTLKNNVIVTVDLKKVKLSSTK